MAAACKHTPGDWCHLCGGRPEHLADIWYPQYAEQGAGKTQYIRICATCADVLAQVARGQIETEPGVKCCGWGTPPNKIRKR